MLVCYLVSKGCHTAENIYSSYELKHTYFDCLSLKKLKYIVSHNTSNMIKAFSLSEFEESATSDACMNFDDDTGNENDDDTTTDPSIIDEDVLEYLPQHQSCFTNTLQLIVKDGMKGIGSLQKVITKASNVVSHIK